MFFDLKKTLKKRNYCFIWALMPEIKALIDWLIDLSFNSYNSIRQRSPLNIEHDNITISFKLHFWMWIFLMK